jgi:hypothetical protein
VRDGWPLQPYCAAITLRGKSARLENWKDCLNQEAARFTMKGIPSFIIPSISAFAMHFSFWYVKRIPIV